MKQCPNPTCKETNADDAVFCHLCGTRLSSVPNTPLNSDRRKKDKKGNRSLNVWIVAIIIGLLISLIRYLLEEL